MEIKEAKDILELIRDNIETPIPEITRTGLAITALTGGIDALGHVEMLKKRFMNGMSAHFTKNDDIECPFCGYKVSKMWHKTNISIITEKSRMDRDFTQKIEVPENGFPKAGKEIEEAFKMAGIIIRAKIERLCNDGKSEEAKKLEEALITINNADYNH